VGWTWPKPPWLGWLDGQKWALASGLAKKAQHPRQASQAHAMAAARPGAATAVRGGAAGGEARKRRRGTG
jgi:hypothetical protein